MCVLKDSVHIIKIDHLEVKPFHVVVFHHVTFPVRSFNTHLIIPNCALWINFLRRSWWWNSAKHPCWRWSKNHSRAQHLPPPSPPKSFGSILLCLVLMGPRGSRPHVLHVRGIKAGLLWGKINTDYRSWRIDTSLGICFELRRLLNYAPGRRNFHHSTFKGKTYCNMIVTLQKLVWHFMSKLLIKDTIKVTCYICFHPPKAVHFP